MVGDGFKRARNVLALCSTSLEQEYKITLLYLKQCSYRTGHGFTINAPSVGIGLSPHGEAVQENVEIVNCPTRCRRHRLQWQDGTRHVVLVGQRAQRMESEIAINPHSFTLLDLLLSLRTPEALQRTRLGTLTLTPTLISPSSPV